MTYKLQRRNVKETTAAGFGKVAHIPRIFDGRPGYHRLSSRFLIDRRLGVWSPKTKFIEPMGASIGRNSIWGYGKCLVNFLNWCKARGVEPTECNFSDHILGGYQREMLSGEWSTKNEALSESTINARVSVACQYLVWLTDKGLRKRPFVIPMRTVKVVTSDPVRDGAEVTRSINKRQGSLRVTKEEMSLPAPKKVRTWLQSVDRRQGATFSLMCESALLSAMRETAITSLRVNVLPDDPRHWNVPNESAPKHLREVLISTKYGTKGPDYGDDSGDKIGQKHTLRIPYVLAERWHHYRNNERQDVLAKWIKAARGPQERKERIRTTVHLFLHPDTGAPISADQFYRAWKNDKVDLPFPQWTVHMARDWWACMTLLDELKKLEVLKKLGKNVAAKLLADAAMPVIDLRIRPQLKHLSVETTRIYLRWAASLMATPLSLQWDNALEAVLGEPA